MSSDAAKGRTIVRTANAPGAIGPYNQAIVSGGVVYTAGQIALDPESGTLVGDGDAAAEARQALQNLTAVLDAAGSGLDLALRCDVFLADMADYQAVNAVYAEFFDAETAPARLAVQAAGLPAGARFEVACIAAVRS